MPSPISMKPYPLAALNHLTLPSGIPITSSCVNNPAGQPGVECQSESPCEGDAAPLWTFREGAIVMPKGAEAEEQAIPARLNFPNPLPEHVRCDGPKNHKDTKTQRRKDTNMCSS